MAVRLPELLQHHITSCKVNLPQKPYLMEYRNKLLITCSHICTKLQAHIKAQSHPIMTSQFCVLAVHVLIAAGYSFTELTIRCTDTDQRVDDEDVLLDDEDEEAAITFLTY